MYFFISDEHYGHKNIIKYCNRPFNSVEEMDEALIRRHNLLVSTDDIVIHAGDFTLKKKQKADYYISCLNGKHIFLRGSHMMPGLELMLRLMRFGNKQYRNNI